MIDVRILKRYPPGPGSAGFQLQAEFQARGGVTALFGPSGSGKTLTLDAIAGFLRPDEGRILLNDRILFDAPSGVHLAPQARRCGYVFQNYALFPHKTLRGNLEFAAASRNLTRAERSRQTAAMLDQFRLADVAGRRPHEVSGGQQQRCSIARALVGSPEVLLLDEPARGLDAPLRAEMYEVLRQVRASFATPMLLVTHDLDECFELADEMLVLHSGRVIQAAAPRLVAEQPASIEVARLLGSFNILPVEIVALDPGRNTSRMRYGQFEIAGHYLPGHFLGDRVHLCVRADRMTALPRDGRPSAQQLPVQLARVVETPSTARMEFDGDLRADVPIASYAAHRHVRDWLLQFPSSGMHVL